MKVSIEWSREISLKESIQNKKESNGVCKLLSIFRLGGERGGSLLGMLVSLVIFSTLLMMLVGVVRHLVVSSRDVRDHVQMLESFIEAEDFFRKELRQLVFVPYCSEKLPSYNEMVVGSGVANDYQDYLQRSVMVSSPRGGVKNAVLDLRALRGSGGGSYEPRPRKNLQGIVLGSEVLQISGFLPVGLSLRSNQIVGELTSDLVGVRSLVFYLTDCRSSMVLEAKREGGAFIVGVEDYQKLNAIFDLSRLQIYVVKEYLIYLQVRNQESSLVVDFLDGQAFWRVPGFVDFRVSKESGGILSLQFLMGKRSDKDVGVILFEKNNYSRSIQNQKALDFRELLIGLE